MKRLSIAILLILGSLTTWAQFPFPDTVGLGQVIHHYAYTLQYSEEHEQPRWVAYELTRQKVEGTFPRRDNFREDPDVITGSATPADYKPTSSTYARGHLAPAGDMKWSQQAMDESFLMSNMSPQLHSFNDGIWNRIENRVRQWARLYDTIWVVTGPVLEPPMGHIGSNHVSVPRYFYKITLDPKRHAAIAFLIAHEAGKGPLQAFATSIDEVEALTGLDFFRGLPDEEAIESSFNLDLWTW